MRPDLLAAAAHDEFRAVGTDRNPAADDDHIASHAAMICRRETRK
jgi:hypothetical protein